MRIKAEKQNYLYYKTGNGPGFAATLDRIAGRYFDYAVENSIEGRQV